MAFGQLFIANPDLPRRLQLDAPLNAPQPETFYHPGAEGYIDYPALASSSPCFVISVRRKSDDDKAHPYYPA